jgi:Protein of unknown function (DUF616)
MTVTVLSAAYGGYDIPWTQPEQDCDVRWVMVTDGTIDVPAQWEHIVLPQPAVHPRLAAKVPKCLPWNYAAPSDQAVIWIDASAQIMTADFVSTCVDVLDGGDVAQWVHPQRDCILPEADVSATMLKYQGLPVRAQAEHYIREGHPENYGLWATGCMVWSVASVASVAAGAEWLSEQYRWTYQDQLSWPTIVRRHNLDVRPLPGGLWDRTYLTFHGHRSDL